MPTIEDIELLALNMASDKKSEKRSKRRPRSWATLDEANILCQHILNHKIALVVEIGTSNGFTAACMATTGVPVLTFDLVDTVKIYKDEPSLCNLIDFRAIPSPECFDYINLPKEPVLFFVDGAHENEARVIDFKRCQSIARSGDIIAMHDVLKAAAGEKFWTNLAKGPAKTFTYFTQNGLGILLC